MASVGDKTLILELQNLSYRELQKRTKALRLPSNVKKVYLIQLIFTKTHGTENEVAEIIQRVKSERLLAAKKITKRKTKKKPTGETQSLDVSSTRDTVSPPLTATPTGRKKYTIRPFSSDFNETERVLRNRTYSIQNAINKRVISLKTINNALNYMDNSVCKVTEREPIVVRKYNNNSLVKKQAKRNILKPIIIKNDSLSRRLSIEIQVKAVTPQRPVKRPRILSNITPLSVEQTISKVQPIREIVETTRTIHFPYSMHRFLDQKIDHTTSYISNNIKPIMYGIMDRSRKACDSNKRNIVDITNDVIKPQAAKSVFNNKANTIQSKCTVQETEYKTFIQKNTTNTITLMYNTKINDENVNKPLHNKNNNSHTNITNVSNTTQTIQDNVLDGTHVHNDGQIESNVESMTWDSSQNSLYWSNNTTPNNTNRNNNVTHSHTNWNNNMTHYNTNWNDNMTPNNTNWNNNMTPKNTNYNNMTPNTNWNNNLTPNNTNWNNNMTPNNTNWNNNMTPNNTNWNNNMTHNNTNWNIQVNQNKDYYTNEMDTNYNWYNYQNNNLINYTNYNYNQRETNTTNHEYYNQRKTNTINHQDYKQRETDSAYNQDYYTNYNEQQLTINVNYPNMRSAYEDNSNIPIQAITYIPDSNSNQKLTAFNVAFPTYNSSDMNNFSTWTFNNDSTNSPLAYLGKVMEMTTECTSTSPNFPIRTDSNLNMPVYTYEENNNMNILRTNECNEQENEERGMLHSPLAILASQETKTTESDLTATELDMDDALEVISQDGDYMSGSGMDTTVKCVVCEWEGVKIQLENHIREEHYDVIQEFTSPELVLSFYLEEILDTEDWVPYIVEDMQGVLYIIYVKFVDPGSMVAGVYAVSSDFNSKKALITMYHKDTLFAHNWQGNVEEYTSSPIIGDNHFQIELSQIHPELVFEGHRLFVERKEADTYYISTLVLFVRVV